MAFRLTSAGQARTFRRVAGQTQRKKLNAAKAVAEQYASEHPLPKADPLRTLQYILDRRTAMLKLVAGMVDDLEPESLTVMGAFGPCEHQHVRLEKDLAQEVSTLCINMERVGLAERLVSVKEAEATLILRALVAAAEESGIPRHQLKSLGPAFRRQLTLLKGGAEEASPEGRAETKAVAA